MTPLLFALTGVLVVPLFIATWRTSLLGLALQGWLMAWIAYRLDPVSDTPSAWLTFADLVLVRGLLAPICLYGVLRAQKASPRNDVIPPNLLSWALALGMVLAAFNFSELLVPEAGEQRTLVAVAAAAVMIGLLILSTQSDPFSQMIGALRIENAIALFELGGERHPHVLGVQLGQCAIVIATILLFRAYLMLLGTAQSGPAVGLPPEGPTL